MGKAPAFQFYPGDWRRDTQVQMATMETRGVWIEMLCCMWDAPERGKLQSNKIELGRLLGCDLVVLNRSLDELNRLKIADVTNCNNEVTVINRRMYREQKQRENTRLRVKKHRDKQAGNADITIPSSSSSSISYKYIVEYLNKKTGKNFKFTTESTRELIRARFSDGYGEDDFKDVIDTKTKQWIEDPKMQSYLRPSTLFGTKFESYLNESTKIKYTETPEEYRARIIREQGG